MATELEALRAFAQAMLKDWPEGSPDPFDIQDEAVKHGLLVKRDPAPSEPCGEHCWCTDYFSAEDWRDGVTCYVRSAVLTGNAGVPAYCACPPSECHGEGVNRCRWCVMEANGWTRPAGVTVAPADDPGPHIVPTTFPMFAAAVARRKWESLQRDGYRMQHIHFARSVDGHERRGSIDPWGKVLWEPFGVNACSIHPLHTQPCERCAMVAEERADGVAIPDGTRDANDPLRAEGRTK